jgi:uncharacterized protein (TIGR03067 family)
VAARARDDAPSGAIEIDLERLQGTWRDVRIETGGGPIPAEVAATVRYIFDEDRVRLMEGDQPAGEGVIRLDPAADPKASDFTATTGPQAGTTARGIDRIERDTLLLCLAGERPSRFSGDSEDAPVELTRVP